MHKVRLGGKARLGRRGARRRRGREVVAVGGWTHKEATRSARSADPTLTQGSRGNRRPDDWLGAQTKDSAKVQIGAELLCKSAKVFLGLEPELGLGLENFSGLGSQPSGARFRSSGSVTGSGSEFSRTRTCT